LLICLPFQKEEKSIMHRTERILIAFMAVLMIVVIGARSLPANQDPTPIQGELIDVDIDAKTLSIRTAEGTVRFHYTDGTAVSGAQDIIASLGSETGVRVTVLFTEQDEMKTATHIEVQPGSEVRLHTNAPQLGSHNAGG
jgi:maltose-binding protein MalE